MRYRFRLGALIVLGCIALAGVLFLGDRITHAGTLYNISDTLSTSVPGQPANHTVAFTTNSAISAGDTIKITFDPVTNAFGGVGNVAFGDVTFTGATLVTSCAAGNDVTLSTSTAPGNESLIFTVCGGATVASGTKTIAVGNDRLINPTSTQSYAIDIKGTMPDSGETRVAIIPAVTVQAAVATNFSFSILGIATGTAINGVTTTGASASTSMAFGLLSPNVPKVLGQELSVSTNAANGFAVTVHEDQDLTSGSGATIHLFDNGDATSTPIPWVAPSAIAAEPATYGHIGVTTDDSLLSGGAYAGAKFVGAFNPTSTLTVFSNTGPGDGTTQNVGKADVAYQIEISGLQAAATDYSNNLIYVATPVF